MVLIDTSKRWSHVCLLSILNIVFSTLYAQIIRLQAQFPDYPIRTIRLDNIDASQTFTNYCMPIRINVEHSITHTHTKNDLGESFIKFLQLIARPILMKTKLSTFA